jgi:hypothetical protein
MCTALLEQFFSELTEEERLSTVPARLSYCSHCTYGYAGVRDRILFFLTAAIIKNRTK